MRYLRAGRKKIGSMKLTPKSQYDLELFSQQIQDSKNPLPIYKQYLEQIHEEQWNAFQNGVPAAELIHQRAWLMDQILILIWQNFFSQEKDIALVAVGGYGRSELHPYSDIDLLILLKKPPKKDRAQQIQAFCTFIWDTGLKLGESVRTIKECVNEAKHDITIATNLLEARAIAGDYSLFKEMEKSVSAKSIWPSEKFFAAKLEEQDKRHEKFGDTAFKLEPNLKDGPGGLRDIHMIGWVAKRHFNVRSYGELLNNGFISEKEYTTLIACQNFLWNVRFALHYLNNRREERLLFDLQKNLALLFGHSDDEKRLAVEHFMKRYYRTAFEINRLNELLLQIFKEAILFPAKSKPIGINKRFQTRDGFIEVTHKNTFKTYPFALLEVFLILQQHPEIQGVRATTIRDIRDHRYLIDDLFRNDIRCRSLFLEILKQPAGLTHEFRRMHRYGILASYLPIFSNIVGQMQYDLFHTYTVDEHTLFVIRNLRRFAVEKYHHEFPKCSDIIRKIPKPELLYLGALFHDIAKGRGGDHSELGEQDAMQFCQHHNLSDYDSKLVGWLVRNHLIMSVVAQKKDISDPEVIKNFAQMVENTNRLNYLYLLTIADIRATNPNLWNDWKASLLDELYDACKSFLEKGPVAIDSKEEKRSKNYQAAVEILRKNGTQMETIENLWQHFYADYFDRYRGDTIAWHTETIIQKTERPLIAVRPVSEHGGTEILIYTHDVDRLFAATTAIFDMMGLNVLNARVNTTRNGFTLDSYLVHNSDNQSLEEPEINRLVEKLKAGLKDPDQVTLDIKRHRPVRFDHLASETKLLFSHDEKNQRSILELHCDDQAGLLSRVGQAFLDCGVRLQDAKISTYGIRVEDAFFITDVHNKPISLTIRQCLNETIKKYLN